MKDVEKKVAGKITLDRRRQKVYVDGIEFPWFIAEEGPTLTRTGALRGRVVDIPVITHDVEIIPENRHET